MHIAKLAEKVSGKPFYTGLNQRMTEDELSEAVDFINEHFVFLSQKTVDSAPSTQSSTGQSRLLCVWGCGA